MTATSMDVFSLRDTVVREYESFATSFTSVCADDLREQLQRVYSDKRFWPEPLNQITPNCKRGLAVDALVRDDALDSVCADVFGTGAATAGEPLALFQHQRKAVALANDGRSYVVTSGTGEFLIFMPRSTRGRWCGRQCPCRIVECRVLNSRFDSAASKPGTWLASHGAARTSS